MYNRKLCCKVPVVGPEGPQGPQGEQGATGAGAQDNGLLFFENLGKSEDKEPAGTYTLNYDAARTTIDGIAKYIDGIATDSSIVLSSVPSGDYWIEIYAHCDAEAGNAGTDNFITIDLVQQNPGTPNSNNPLDIDTRSVSKGGQAHISFGPAAYRLGSSLPNPTGRVDRNATYRLQVTTGRPYFLSEIKLIIKVRPYV